MSCCAESNAGVGERVHEVASFLSAPQVHPQRILIPVDFSDDAEAALRVASGMAEAFQSELCVLFVLAWETRLAGTEEEAGALRLARQKLAEVVRNNVPEYLEVLPQVRAGKPWREIVEIAREWPADLIIIPTHGHTGLKHLFLGSTAECVVRYAPCPTLVLRQGALERWSAIDFAPNQPKPEYGN
jgi:universal stress protein A